MVFGPFVGVKEIKTSPMPTMSDFPNMSNGEARRIFRGRCGWPPAVRSVEHLSQQPMARYSFGTPAGGPRCARSREAEPMASGRVQAIIAWG